LQTLGCAQTTGNLSLFSPVNSCEVKFDQAN
jgi:hypothetical protein